jgi:hypothetical protein
MPMREASTSGRCSSQSTHEPAHASVSMRAVRPCSRSASPVPGWSSIRQEMPRAASSAQCPDEYMCSLAESRPLTSTITGAGPSSAAGAWLK